MPTGSTGTIGAVLAINYMYDGLPLLPKLSGQSIKLASFPASHAISLNHFFYCKREQESLATNYVAFVLCSTFSHCVCSRYCWPCYACSYFTFIA